MSPLIEMDFDSTPDRNVPLKIGIRTLDIKDVRNTDDDGEPLKSAKGKPFTEVEFEVNEPDNEDDEHGRKTYDRFFLENQPARVKFKQLCLSAGLGGTGQGVDTSDLIGQTVRAEVKPNVYKDADTGETKENTQIKSYIFD